MKFGKFPLSAINCMPHKSPHVMMIKVEEKGGVMDRREEPGKGDLIMACQILIGRSFLCTVVVVVREESRADRSKRRRL